MAISRSEKGARRELLTEELRGMKGAVFTDYRGLSVREITELRSRLRDVGASYRVVKYTLLERALAEAGLSAPLDQVSGPLGVAFARGDITAVAKVAAGFARETEKLAVTGGIVDGEWTDLETMRRLALLPSREELYASIVGSLAAPMSGLVGVLQAVPRGLVSVLGQYQQAKAN